MTVKFCISLKERTKLNTKACQIDRKAILLFLQNTIVFFISIKGLSRNKIKQYEKMVRNCNFFVRVFIIFFENEVACTVAKLM
jgi:hypothetical protein